MTEEQAAIWGRLVANMRQHRAEYQRLLQSDEDWAAKTPGRAATLEPHMSGLRKLIAECDAVLAVNTLVEAQLHGRAVQP